MILQGAVIGLVIGVFILVLQRKQLISKGVGVKVKYLHHDKYVWELFRKERRAYETSGRLQVFDEYVRCADELVGELIGNGGLNNEKYTSLVNPTSDLSPALKRALSQLVEIQNNSQDGNRDAIPRRD